VQSLTLDHDYSLPLYLFLDYNLDPKAGYLEQYFFQQYRSGLRSTVLLSCFIQTFGITAARALHDIWIELQSTGKIL